jgi:hypothetical protein
VYLKGGTLTAAGQITGGTGGTSELCPDPQFSRGGSGGAGVFINGGTLIASATISGGQAGEDNAAGVPPGVLGDAVQFSAPIGVAPVAGTLVVDPGAVFNGQVGADSRVNDTLELAGSTAATLMGLGTQRISRRWTLPRVRAGPWMPSAPHSRIPWCRSSPRCAAKRSARCHIPSASSAMSGGMRVRAAGSPSMRIPKSRQKRFNAAAMVSGEPVPSAS